MQNKPNFRKAKMNLNFYLTKDYENENHPQSRTKQTQYEPNLSRRSTCCKSAEAGRSPIKPNFKGKKNAAAFDV